MMPTPRRVTWTSTGVTKVNLDPLVTNNVINLDMTGTTEGQDLPYLELGSIAVFCE